VNLVMGSEQVRSLREEKEYPNGTARGRPRAFLRRRLRTSRKVKLFEEVGG
jgi:hypothetical protein